jgi:hypothetical protein
VTTLPPAPAADETAMWEQDGLDSATHGQARAKREGTDLDELAFTHLEQAGATILKTHFKVGAVSVDALVVGPNQRQFWVLAHGNVDVDSSAKQPGLRRTDTTRKVIGDAAVLARKADPLAVLVVTSHLPTRNRADKAARAWLEELAPFVHDVVSIHSDLRGFQRLRRHLTEDQPATRGRAGEWVEGPWNQLSLTSLEGWDHA